MREKDHGLDTEGHEKTSLNGLVFSWLPLVDILCNLISNNRVNNSDWDFLDH